MSGLFIAFEGGEGAGKSTQAALLADSLRGNGHTVVMTREPGGSPVAEKIRQVVLDVAHAGLNDRSEALLFAASRAEHVAKTIRPALARGEIVLTDRYMDSSIAYQGIARGLGLKDVEDLNLWATENLVPAITVLLDVDPTQGLSRVADPNRLEAESVEFHHAVRAAFLQLAEIHADRYVVIKADRDRHEIAAEILEVVLQRLSAK